MRRSWKYITGASAVVLAAVAVTQLSPSGPQPSREAGSVRGEASPPDVGSGAAVFVADAAPMPAPADGAAAAGEIAARIDDLTVRLADRETALAAMTASLAERDASLDAVTTTLTLREAEIQALRDELASLRERYAFDIELEAIKGRGTLEGQGRPLEPNAPAEALLVSVEETAGPDGPGILALTQIHFETGSSSLTPGGQVHAAAAAVMLAEMPVVRVRLLGYADRVGSPTRNRALAAARARAVADFLVRSGVAADILDPEGMGEDDLPVATGAGVAEPLNRSVAIVAIPRPTS
jgi:outer membrane protein OmpA-like peptidoglycan-associated protein